MSFKVDPRYEILFEDLKNHSIDEYLISRAFKIEMMKNGYYELWQKNYAQTKKERSYIVIGINHDKEDNINTLGGYLNFCFENTEIQNVVTLIISSFIEWKQFEENFEDIIESTRMTNFSQGNIEKIENAYNAHIQKQLTKKGVSNIENFKRESIMNNNVFVVHGHNVEIKESVARTLVKLKLNPIILHEQSNQGLTIIEKFEKHSNVGFSIVLLTHDDYGYEKSKVKEKSKRARQNVVLELGYFIGKLGRKRVMTLYEQGVELPSDIVGILYTPIDENGKWQFSLVSELKAAGFKISADDIL